MGRLKHLFRKSLLAGSAAAEIRKVSLSSLNLQFTPNTAQFMTALMYLKRSKNHHPFFCLQIKGSDTAVDPI